MTVTPERKVGCEFSTDGSTAIHRLDNGNDIHYVRHMGIYFNKNTNEEVVFAINHARAASIPIRIYYGDTETGRDWLDEHDMDGKVGNSMGPLKIPLIIGKGEHGGPAMLDHCIVKIKFMGKEKGRVAYQHPLYHCGTFTKSIITKDNDLYKKGYRFSVEVDGHTHASFKKESQADAFMSRWID